MLKVLYVLATLSLFVCLFLSFERPAMAYIDPGSGLFVLQSISSIFVGALFFMRRRLRMLFRRQKAEAVDAQQGKTTAEAAAAYSRYDKAA